MHPGTYFLPSQAVAFFVLSKALNVGRKSVVWSLVLAKGLLGELIDIIDD